jgi:hypothetical protein
VKPDRFVYYALFTALGYVQTPTLFFLVLSSLSLSLSLSLHDMFLLFMPDVRLCCVLTNFSMCLVA